MITYSSISSATGVIRNARTREKGRPCGWSWSGPGTENVEGASCRCIACCTEAEFARLGFSWLMRSSRGGDVGGTWWLGLEGWQLEAQEVVPFRVGDLRSFDPQVNWRSRPTIVKSAQTSSERLRDNFYRLALRIERQGALTRGADGPYFTQISGQYSSLRLMPGGWVMGLARLEVSPEYGDSQVLSTRATWEILSILKRLPIRYSSEWHPVASTDDSDSIYLLECAHRAGFAERV